MRPKHVLLKVGGAVCADAKTADYLAAAIKRLQREHIRVTIVHGGGPQLDAAITALGEPVVKHRGLRVTSQRAATVVLGVMDRIGADLTAALAHRGVAVRHVPAHEGRFGATPKDLGDGVSLGRVGTMKQVDAPAADPAEVLVLTPVGRDSVGPLNVNADEAAAAAAAAVRAHLLLLVTDVAAVRDGSGQAQRVLDAGAAQALIASGAASGGMIPKLEAALTALAAGVPEAWIGTLAATGTPDLLAACASTGTWVHQVGTVLASSPPRSAEAAA